MGDTFPILTDLNYSYQLYNFVKLFPFILINHNSMKLSSILQMEKSIITTTGTFTSKIILE